LRQFGEVMALGRRFAGGSSSAQLFMLYPSFPHRFVEPLCGRRQ
jgi:hypothetical protein